MSRELKDYVRLLLTIDQLNRMYNEFSRQIFEVLDIEVPLPEIDDDEYDYEYVNVEDLAPCMHADPLFAILFKCPIDGRLTIDEIEIDDDSMIVWQSRMNWWIGYMMDDVDMLQFDNLRSAYILYKLSKYKTFTQALDEIAKRAVRGKRRILEKAVERVRKSIEFAEAIVQAVGNVYEEDGEEDVSVVVNEDDVQRIFDALENDAKKGNASVLIPIGGIEDLPTIPQHIHVDRYEFVPKYTTAIRRSKTYSWLSNLNYIYRVIASGNKVDVLYHYSRNDITARQATLPLDQLTVGTFLILADLEENYRTLSYIAGILAKLVRRASKALKMAKEIATLAIIMGGKHG